MKITKYIYHFYSEWFLAWCKLDFYFWGALNAIYFLPLLFDKKKQKIFKYNIANGQIFFQQLKSFGNILLTLIYL